MNESSLEIIKEKCFHFFQNENIKKNMREIIKPIGTLIYNELFIYIWFLCIYNVVLFLIITTVLILLLRKQQSSNSI